MSTSGTRSSSCQAVSWRSRVPHAVAFTVAKVQCSFRTRGVELATLSSGSPLATRLLVALGLPAPVRMRLSDCSPVCACARCCSMRLIRPSVSGCISVRIWPTAASGPTDALAALDGTTAGGGVFRECVGTGRPGKPRADSASHIAGVMRSVCKQYNATEKRLP
eukprot:6492301-Amphidinium_carterae.2